VLGGQRKALPVFSVHADGLLLSVETWKNPRRVLNPLCTLQHGKIAPFWMHEAWLEAMCGMRIKIHPYK
ncbi:hypothetical protein AAIH05_34290, partial [Pseudomonas aeruginosa]